MAPAGTNLPERVQFLRPRRPEQAVPRLGADPHDAGQAPLDVAKFHRPKQSGKVAAERAHGRAMVRPGLDRHDHEDRGTGERRGDRLRNGTHITRRFGSGHRIGLHRWHPLRVRGIRCFERPRSARVRASGREIIIACRRTSMPPARMAASAPCIALTAALSHLWRAIRFQRFKRTRLVLARSTRSGIFCPRSSRDR